jgi:hypothetical protein
MRRVLTSAAVVAVGLAVVGTAQAGGRGGFGGLNGGTAIQVRTGGPGGFSLHIGTPVTRVHVGVPVINHVVKPVAKVHVVTPFTNYLGAPVSQNYFVTYSRKASFGYFFPGRVHTHWTRRVFSDYYGCYTYYCPFSTSWYYWCEPFGCYYPVTYCPTGIYVY